MPYEYFVFIVFMVYLFTFQLRHDKNAIIPKLMNCLFLIVKLSALEMNDPLIGSGESPTNTVIQLQCFRRCDIFALFKQIKLLFN